MLNNVYDFKNLRGDISGGLVTGIVGIFAPRLEKVQSKVEINAKF